MKTLKTITFLIASLLMMSPSLAENNSDLIAAIDRQTAAIERQTQMIQAIASVTANLNSYRTVSVGYYYNRYDEIIRAVNDGALDDHGSTHSMPSSIYYEE